MNKTAIKVSPLLFGSGLCALIYQIAWTRELRLIFGASTAASAAVIAIFIGGLGLGGYILGKRSERHERPLALYAHLELLIATAAALSPALLWIVRAIYIRSGGSVTLGLGGGTIVRLLLSIIALLIPTFLMGGTLPAAARAVSSARDTGRRSVALLYGINTLGAVTGCFVSNFFMLESFGTRRTLWMAAILNLIVGVSARALSTSIPFEPEATDQPEEEVRGAGAPAWFALMAAAVVGFAFFLMEIVWYRMLGPILGGSGFTFGLILAVALVGIGLGSALYANMNEKRAATLTGFAWTCLLEAAFIAIPFALGDRVALFALLLRPLGNLGFWGFVLSWTAVSGLVVFPAAFVSGVQFPLLIALLGKGNRQVGRQIGLTYGWNTIGAIIGSLAGGFGLLPFLGATGSWRLVAYVLTALGASALVLSTVREKAWVRLIPQALLAVAVLALLSTTGPTAAWRHSPIGAGRVAVTQVANPNMTKDWINHRRRTLQWQADGVESSVGLVAEGGGGYAFVVNGKIDGNARSDAPTQAMSGVLGAILHPNAKNSLVVGLGTGSSAGWLGAIPLMESVDVIELEPAILHVARDCSPVNQNVLSNPKVHVTIGDAREVLQTTPKKYDVIFSEPSNPYRAGVASLFTQDYYQSAKKRLTENGLFVQWVQAYEVDTQTIETIYATIGSVYPFIETWQARESDLLLVCSDKPLKHDPVAIRARIAQEPYKSALGFAWRVSSIEGVFGHFIGRSSMAKAIIAQHTGGLNTDDLSPVEFGFARSVGAERGFEVWSLLDAARTRKEEYPELLRSDVNLKLLEDHRAQLPVVEMEAPHTLVDQDSDQRSRNSALALYIEGKYRPALKAWRAQPRDPINPLESSMLGDLLAESAEDGAMRYAEELRSFQPTESDIIAARLALRQSNAKDAAALLERAFDEARKDAWPSTMLLYRSLGLAEEVAGMDPELALRMFNALAEPFSIRALNEERIASRMTIVTHLETKTYCEQALRDFEPNIPWTKEHLTYRKACYLETGNGLAAKATAELAEYLSHDPVLFELPADKP